MELMAHRGNSALAPENTLAAFTKALESHPHWAELDVHLSADGHLIVMHDGAVDRTTDGQGAIAELTLAQIKQLDAGSWFGPEFAGEPVPTLAEVVERVGRQLRLNVEIKKSPGTDSGAAQVVQTLRDGGILAQSMISSFDLEALREAQKLTSECALAFLTGQAADLEVAHAEGMAWLNLYYEAADAALLTRAREIGVKVMLWTMNDPARWSEFADMGVAALCTDAPHLMPPVR